VLADEANEIVAADGFMRLPVKRARALRAGSHAVDHRDPFDRMLAAQGELDTPVLVARDPAFAGFGSKTLW